MQNYAGAKISQAGLLRIYNYLLKRLLVHRELLRRVALLARL